MIGNLEASPLLKIKKRMLLEYGVDVFKEYDTLDINAILLKFLDIHSDIAEEESGVYELKKYLDLEKKLSSSTGETFESIMQAITSNYSRGDIPKKYKGRNSEIKLRNRIRSIKRITGNSNINISRLESMPVDLDDYKDEYILFDIDNQKILMSRDESNPYMLNEISDRIIESLTKGEVFHQNIFSGSNIFLTVRDMKSLVEKFGKVKYENRGSKYFIKVG